MRSGGLQCVRQEIRKMETGERRLLFGYLVKSWKLVVPGYYPSPAIYGYQPRRPLLGYLNHLSTVERKQIMRELCAELSKSCPEGIPAQPEIPALAAH